MGVGGGVGVEEGARSGGGGKKAWRMKQQIASDELTALTRFRS